MKIYYDLHIHTSLSPCASDDMTPNNIINMALLKKLDVIGITDHNSYENVEPVYSLGKEKGILVVPGLEVQTKEEVHLLCYFYSIDYCIEIGEIVNEKMKNIKNNKTIFGNQFIMNKQDEIIGEKDNLLLSCCDLGLEDIFKIIEGKGVCVPAHVDRTANSIIYNLGFIPEIPNLNTIEVSKNKNLKNFFEEFPCYKKYRVIRSSDAHYLGDISERDEFLNCFMELKSIIDWLRGN